MSAHSIHSNNQAQAANNSESSLDTSQNQWMLRNLDVKIFLMTIFISVVLLGIAVTEFCIAFKIIHEVTSLLEWKFLLYYLITESVPSLFIACFLDSQKYGPEKGKDNQDLGDTENFEIDLAEFSSEKKNNSQL